VERGRREGEDEGEGVERGERREVELDPVEFHFSLLPLPTSGDAFLVAYTAAFFQRSVDPLIGFSPTGADNLSPDPPEEMSLVGLLLLIFLCAGLSASAGYGLLQLWRWRKRRAEAAAQAAGGPRLIPMQEAQPHWNTRAVVVGM
jgi:hypothetical protein